MLVDVVIVSDNEAMVFYRPSKIMRFLASYLPTLFEGRTSFTPIVRMNVHPNHEPPNWMWIHKYTGRPVGDGLLFRLEQFPVRNEVRQALLAAAMENENDDEDS